MLLLKEFPSSAALQKFTARFPDADIGAMTDFLHILRAGSDISEALNALLGQHGLQQGRWWVLVLLMREHEFTSTPSDLAQKAGVSRPTMTGFIDNLVREGLVARTSDTQDRRKLLIQLTSAGQQKLDTVMPVYYQWVKILMSSLAAMQRQELVDSMQQLADQAAQLK